MSQARLIITAVVLEGRSQAQVAREYDVYEAWVSRLVTRRVVSRRAIAGRRWAAVVAVERAERCAEVAERSQHPFGELREVGPNRRPR